MAYGLKASSRNPLTLLDMPDLDLTAVFSDHKLCQFIVSNIYKVTQILD